MNHPDELATDGRPESSVHSASKITREEFWADTCREVTQMLHGSQKVIDLYRQFGCRFCAPTSEQVHHVLSALDSAITSWEADHPELFYQTLELNYPELVRRS